MDKQNQLVVTDSAHESQKSLSHIKKRINKDYREFKQGFTLKDALNLERMNPLYDLIQRLFFMIDCYEQQITEHSQLLTTFFFNLFHSQTAVKDTNQDESVSEKKEINTIKNTVYVMLYHLTNQQLTELQHSVEKLLNMYPLLKDHLQNNEQSASWIELPTAKTIVLQIRCVEKYLTLCQNRKLCRNEIAFREPFEKSKIEKFHQIKKLFHALYTQSVRQLMAVMINRMKIPIPVKLHSFSQMLIIKHIAYTQAYADLCPAQDPVLHSEIAVFNKRVLNLLGEDYPKLPVVQKAYQIVSMVLYPAFNVF